VPILRARVGKGKGSVDAESLSKKGPARYPTSGETVVVLEKKYFGQVRGFKKKFRLLGKWGGCSINSKFDRVFGLVGKDGVKEKSGSKNQPAKTSGGLSATGKWLGTERTREEGFALAPGTMFIISRAKGLFGKS